MELSLHLILALMPGNYTANYWPFPAIQCKLDVAPVTGLHNVPHCLRNPRGRKNPGSLVRHVPGEQWGPGRESSCWMAGVEQDPQLREGKAPALRDGVTQRWLLPGDREQTEQWQQVQTAGNLRAKFPSLRQPLCLFFVIPVAPAKASQCSLCSSCECYPPLLSARRCAPRAP